MAAKPAGESSSLRGKSGLPRRLEDPPAGLAVMLVLYFPAAAIGVLLQRCGGYQSAAILRCLFTHGLIDLS